MFCRHLFLHYMPCSSSLFGICIFCLFIFLALSYFEFIIRIPQIAKNDKCFRKNSKYFSVPTLCIFLKYDKNLRQHFLLLFLVSFFRRFPALFYKIFFILKKFRREKFETSPARCCFLPISNSFVTTAPEWFEEPLHRPAAVLLPAALFEESALSPAVSSQR